MRSGSKAVPGATMPQIVTVAACTPLSFKSANRLKAKVRMAALPTPKLAMIGIGSKAKPPPVNKMVPERRARIVGSTAWAAANAPKTLTDTSAENCSGLSCANGR